jgi:hypothetical protein
MKKRNKIIYWIATVWLSLGMVSTGIVQLLKAKGGGGSPAPGGIEAMAHLGYPAYLLTILGIWKILGVVALLIPKFPILKEWAYAGFFFAMSGAVYSHIATGDPGKELFPSFLLIALILVSWFFRPADRRIIPAYQ